MRATLAPAPRAPLPGHRPGVAGVAVAGLAALLAACGSSDPTAPTDAPPDAGPCWPVEGTTPGGAIEMGTGEATWAPIPSTLKLQTGFQGAGFLYIHARLQGLEPGDPTDFMSPGNPRTRIQAKLIDGTVIGGDCPSRIGYAPRADGYDYWQVGQMLVFLPFSAEQVANNTNVDITIELIDSARHYARDQKTIFVTPRDRVAADGPGDPRD